MTTVVYVVVIDVVAVVIDIFVVFVRIVDALGIVV